MTKTTEAIRAIEGKPGLKMSYKKTEIMFIGLVSSANPTVPLGNERLIKVVGHFKYLGAICFADGKSVKELNSRIGKASAFRELDKDVARSKHRPGHQNKNFTMPVSFPHFCMHVSAGHSMRETRPDLMPLTAKTSWREFMQKYINGLSYRRGRGCNKGADYVEVSLESGCKCSSARC